MKRPFDSTLLDGILGELEIADIAQATIRQSGEIARRMEKATGEEFSHLEMGVPGLRPEEIGVEAERAALAAGDGETLTALLEDGKRRKEEIDGR